MFEKKLIILIVLSIWIQCLYGYYYNDSISCNDYLQISVGDHILFEYEFIFQNGTSGPSIKKPKQLAYLVLETEISDEIHVNKVHPLIGLCKESTRMFTFPTNSKSSPLPSMNLKLSNAISSLDELIILKVTIDSITTSQDYTIFDALKVKNTSLVIDLIQAGVGINAVDKWGQTPLMIAAIQKDMSIFVELLNARYPKVDVNKAKPSGFTAIFYVIENFPVSHLMALLSKGADTNAKIKQKGSMWNSPLHVAVMLDKIEHVDVLVNSEYAAVPADPYAINEFGQSPFQMLPQNIDTKRRKKYQSIFDAAKKKSASQLEYNDDSEL